MLRGRPTTQPPHFGNLHGLRLDGVCGTPWNRRCQVFSASTFGDGWTSDLEAGGWTLVRRAAHMQIQQLEPCESGCFMSVVLSGAGTVESLDFLLVGAQCCFTWLVFWASLPVHVELPSILPGQSYSGERWPYGLFLNHKLCGSCCHIFVLELTLWLEHTSDLFYLHQKSVKLPPLSGDLPKVLCSSQQIFFSLSTSAVSCSMAWIPLLVWHRTICTD